MIRRFLRRHPLAAAAGLTWCVIAKGGVAADVPALPRVAGGFRAAWYADHNVVHDTFCLTVDVSGRPVVSGPGYIAVLPDADADGRADRVATFIDGPRTGAQGLLHEGRAGVLAVGDAGLLRYRDADVDGRADGPPETLVPIPTGREHHAHAVRRGPDGALWWVIGNFAGVDSDDINDPESPVVRPRAGVLLRVVERRGRPPLVSCFAHGFRNAYDFDFAPDGTPLVYDSDGERDVSLPWYRPTRLFAVASGTDAGWVSRSWKRDDGSPFMPPVVVSTGRASPTGVAVTTDPKWLRPHRGAEAVVVFCDWAFGRVFLLPVDRHGRRLDGRPPRLLLAAGDDGFAPTDCEFAGDRLYVSVGGRDTRGGVLIVEPTWTAVASAKTPEVSGPSARDDLRAVPVGSERVDRVNEIVNAFRGRDAHGLERAALRLARLGPETRRTVRRRARTGDVRLGCLLAEAARVTQGEEPQGLRDVLRFAADLVADVRAPSWQRRRAAAVVAVLAGGVGSVEDGAAVFDGYRLRRPPADRELFVGALGRMFAAYPTGLLGVDRELQRVAAVFAWEGVAFRDAVLRESSSVTSVVDLVERLIVLARIDVPADTNSRTSTADALIRLVRLADSPGVPVDRNWPLRVVEIVTTLCEHDPRLAEAVVGHRDFGGRVDALLASALPAAVRASAVDRLVAAAGDDPDRWSADGVALLADEFARKPLPSRASVLRALAADASYADAAVLALASRPDERDRPLFVGSVKAASLDTTAASLRALISLTADRERSAVSRETIAAIAVALARLEWVRADRRVRDDAVRTLRRLSGENFGYETGRPADVRQAKSVSRWLAAVEVDDPGDAVAEEWARVRRFLEAVPPGAGDPRRGAAVFRGRTCASCHNGAGAVGPDLAGVTRRFVRSDLFRAIVDPDRHVGSRYRGVRVVTGDGEVVLGVPVSGSATGITLRSAGGRMRQIAAEDLVSQEPMTGSLMPAGLLSGLDASGLSDLEAYLSSR